MIDDIFQILASIDGHVNVLIFHEQDTILPALSDPIRLVPCPVFSP